MIRRVVLALLSSLAIFAAHAGHPERAGIGLLSPEEIRAMSGSPAQAPARAAAAAAASAPFEARRSLFVTDENIVSQFSFADVMTALAAGAPKRQKLTKETLFSQWMDTLMPAPGLGLGPNCVARINDLVNDCRAGFLFPPVSDLPFTGTSEFDFTPIALVNRFDLAGRPQDGATDCGEYRIIFARNSGKTNTRMRHLIAFEAVLPNPAPNGTDLAGCLPVARFWASLSAIPDSTERARQLRAFFFQGLPGFEPVIAARHYGRATANATGQIRSNAFLNHPLLPISQTTWSLREFVVSISSTQLLIKQVALDTSPAVSLFDETSTNPRVAVFRSDFQKQVASLSINDLNGFHMDTLHDKYDVPVGIQHEEPIPFLDALFARRLQLKSPKLQRYIQVKIVPPSTLTPIDIAERAQAMTCAGCHLYSSGANLGGGLVFPQSLVFTHTSESQARMENSPDGGLRFLISPALQEVFLPHRERILKAFLGQ